MNIKWLLILFVFAGEGTVLHGRYILAYGCLYRLSQLGKPTQELRLEALVESQHVVEHQYLAVACVARTDTYHGAADSLGDLCGQCGRYFLQHDGEAAGFVQQLGIMQQLVGLGFLLGTQSVAAKLVDRLRRESQMTHHGDTGLHHPFNLRQDLLAALQLHAIAAGLFQDAYGIAYGIFCGNLITTEGHVTDYQAVLRSAYDATSQENHLIYGNGERVLVSANYIAAAIAYQEYIDTRFVHQTGQGEIIRCEHGDFLAVLLHHTQPGSGHTGVLYVYRHLF